MITKKIIKKIGLNVHLLHDRAYSYWKVREAGLALREPLTAQERPFFLQFYPYLQGNNLVVFDIGASTGTLCGCLAKISTVSRVDAFEPIPSVFKRLSERVERYPQVVCHNVGLGDSNSKMEMLIMDQDLATSSFLTMDEIHKQEFSGACESHKETLTVVKLDDYVLENNLPVPHLVKMDVQGFEEKVIEGGIATICKAKLCSLEMSLEQLYIGSPLFDDIYQLMKKLGFRLIGLDSLLKGKSGKTLVVDGIFQNEELINNSGL